MNDSDLIKILAFIIASLVSVLYAILRRKTNKNEIDIVVLKEFKVKTEVELQYIKEGFRDINDNLKSLVSEVMKGK